MQDIVNQITKLPLTVKAVVLLVIVVVIGALYIFLGVNTKRQTISELKIQVADLSRKKTESMTIAANRDKLEEEVSLMNEKLKQALTLLPNESDIRGIWRQLSILANKTGIDVLSFKPGSPSSKGLFSEIPLDLRLSGAYNEIAVYFDRIGKLSRIINIRDIQMSSPVLKSNVYKVQVQCQAVTFMSAGSGG